MLQRGFRSIRVALIRAERPSTVTSVLGRAFPIWLGVRTCGGGTTPASRLEARRETQRHEAANMRRSQGFVSHARMLQMIARGDDTPSQKRRRVQGIVRKMEAHCVDWLAELTLSTRSDPGNANEAAVLLAALKQAKPFLESHRLERMGGIDSRKVQQFVSRDEADEGEWSGVSPYFGPELSDALCLCLRLAAAPSSQTPAAQQRELLDCAVTLELSDTDALQTLVRVLTSREYCATCSAHELVETLRLLSLAVKRCKLQPPPLDHVLCRLPGERALSARDALQVLSSLVRLKDSQRAVEVANAVSRNAVASVPLYTVKDVVYGLEAVAILNTCHEAYAGAVLDRCTELAPSMTPRALGDVCKYVALLQPHRPANNVAVSCSREIRRVLPALAQRAEELVGTFSLRDARYVLRCLTQHKVRHSLLFSRLTPFASDG